MRKIIVIALLAVSVNCYASDISIWAGSTSEQKATSKKAGRQTQAQVPQGQLSRRR